MLYSNIFDDEKYEHTEADAEHDLGEDEMEESTIVTMVDQETGEEYEFEIADEFDFEDEVYLVLLTTDEDPEAVFVRVVSAEDGSEALESLGDEEFDRVAAEYDRLCELEEFEDEDDDFDEDEDEDENEDDEDEE